MVFDYDEIRLSSTVNTNIATRFLEIFMHQLAVTCRHVTAGKKKSIGIFV